MTRLSSSLAALVTLLLALGLPLLGRIFAGRPLADLFHFPPPLQIPTDYLRFSWVAAVAVAFVFVATFAPWFRPRCKSSPIAKAEEEAAALRAYRLPFWGWLAIASN